ncbi:hypothetical protein LOTGIDRAFT_167115 [Lottia gigantea]|uniref:Uncharacterized protein n=1 Tax=Lottia gigantea TaxID=225164 RepID=V3ZVG3_LOTGI|nr:hypothetical protein LOTGIDRAFT_167115 [Lottia gigantea]ESO86590.1 hypothetical protein LOTGIDRAFT_167115 [Lottia gigantea]
MGKHGGSSKTMKHLGMCDNLNAQNSRDSLLLKDNEEQNEANYPVTVKLFDRFEDVEDVKLKVKSKQMNNIQSDINQWNGKDENVIFSPKVGEINSNGGHNLSNTGCECSGGNVTNSNMVNGSCLSSELDKLHVSDTSNLGRHRSVSDTKLIRLDSPALPTYTEKSHTKVKAGLLMSPIALTQDIPIDIGKDQNRFSYVMENIPSLLYLPNTKQLVRSQPVSRQNSIGSHGAHSNGVEDLHKEICIDANTSFNGNDQSLELVSPESNSSFSETCPFPVGANDNSNIDADQMTLNSVECLIPGELNDRGCNDTSSLSSVSTDFSTTVGEDNSEFKNVSLEGDETGFMEVNLHSRNSYQRSQSSASDETKSKKKGFGNFLSR